MTNRMTKKVFIGILCAILLVVLMLAAMISFAPKSDMNAEAATTYTLNITVTSATTDVYNLQSVKYEVTSVKVTFGGVSSTINGSSGSTSITSSTDSNSISFTLYYMDSVSRLDGSGSIANSQSVDCYYNAGHTMVYHGTVNYNASKTTNVVKENPTVTAPTAKSNLTYTGNDQTLINAGSTTGGTMQYNVDGGAWSTDLPTGTNAKTSYSVGYKVVGNDSYNDVAAQYINVSIGKANNPLSFTSSQSVNKTFSTSSQTASITAATSGQGTVTYSIQSQKNSSNANVSFFSISGTTLTLAANTTAGTYTVVVRATAAGNSNYNSGTKDSTVTVTVNRANITPSVTMNNWTYGGTASSPSVSGNSGSGTVTYNYKVQGANDSTYATTKPTNAGNYTVKATVAQTTNYNGGTATKDFTINKASLTVTAKAKTVTYGDAPANDGVSYSGFVNNETSSVLGGTLAYSYSYSQYGNVGSYTITPSGYTSSNYTISYTTGTLTVIAKPITVTITPKSSVYGSARVALSAADNGIVNNDTGVYTLSCDVTETTGVGGYAITGTDTSDNYDVTFVGEAGAYTVLPKDVTVAAENKNKIYRNADPVLTATATGFVSGETEELISYILTRAAGENVGEYVITPSGEALQGNYSVSYVTATFTIGQRTVLDPAIILARSSYPYDAAQDSAPRVTVKDGEVVIPEDEYTVIYANNRNPASYDSANPPSATIVDKVGGNYVLTFDPAENATVTFTIEPGQSYIEEVPKAALGLTYDGESHSLITAGSAVNGVVLYRLGTTSAWTDSVPVATNAGTYHVYYKVDGNENYNDWNGGNENGQELIVVIAKKALSIVAANKNKVYDHNVATDPELTCVVTGTLPGETIDYELIREPGQNAGDYAITVVLGDNPNYDVQAQDAIFSIAKKPMIITADSGSKTYDGSALTKNSYFNTSPAEGDVVESVAFDGVQTVVGSTDNVPSGAVILRNGTDDVTANYEITYINGTLTVTNATLTDVTVAQAGSLVYNGTAQIAVVDAQATSQGEQEVFFTYSDSYDGAYASAVPAFTDAGEYTVYFTASAANHNDAHGSFIVTVDRKSIAGATITLGAELIYNGSAQTQEVSSVVIDGLNVTYNVSGNVETNAGYYELTVIGTGNYTGTETKNYLIAAKDIIVAAEAKSKTYGEEDPELTAVVIGLVGSTPIEYVIGRASGENAGEYAIVIVLGDNPDYNVTKTDSVLTIRPLTIGIEWTHTDDLVYSMTAQAPTATATGLINGDVVELTALGGQVSAGSGYTATAAFATEQINYVLPQEITTTFSIARKEATVTIAPKSSVYGEARVDLTAQEDGIVEGDRAYRLDCEVTARSDVGTYDIIGAATSDNYEIAFVGGENAYTVVKKTVTVVADAKSKTYGESDPALTYSITGLVGGDETIGELTRTAGEAVGHYDILLGTLTCGDNYDVVFEGKQLSIAKRSLRIIADDKYVVFGDEKPEYTATYNGFIRGENKGVLSGALTFACSYEKDDEIGTYTIAPRGLMSDNYEITFVTGTLTVKPVAISTEDVKVSIEKEEGEEEEGFDLNIALEVAVKTAVKAKEQEAAREELPVTANLGDRDLVAAIYNVKLIRTITENGMETTEEIQPEDINPGTKVTIAMKIPESVKNQSFRIMHVHSETDVEYVEDFTQDGDTVYITVDRLSDFAFIVNDSRIEFGGTKFSVLDFSLLWLIIFILLALVIIIFIIYVRKENRRYGRRGR